MVVVLLGVVAALLGAFGSYARDRARRLWLEAGRALVAIGVLLIIGGGVMALRSPNGGLLVLEQLLQIRERPRRLPANAAEPTSRLPSMPPGSSDSFSYPKRALSS